MRRTLLRWTGLLPLLGFTLLSGCSMAHTAAEFSPDGSRLVLPAMGAEPLRTVNADGTELQRLVGTEHGSAPKWSPDGARILLAREHDAAIYDVAARRTTSVGGGLQPPFAWSADSRSFAAFRQDGEGHWSLLRCRVPDAAVSTEVRLPVDSVDAEGLLLWLPRTNNILFLAQDQDGVDLWSVEGETARRITHTGDVTGVGATPDGVRWLWTRSVQDVNPFGLRLFAYDPARRTAARLPFAEPAPGVKVQPRAGIQDVRFSPDGTRLAMAGLISHGMAVYLADLEGKQIRVLADAVGRTSHEGPPALLAASWSADSGRVAVYRSGPHPALHLFDRDGGQPVTVALPAPPPGAAQEP